MNRKFLDQYSDFIFVNDRIRSADIIFVPGNGNPEPAERAAALYRTGVAPLVLPSGKYSKVIGHFEGVKNNEERYAGPYATEWEFLRDVLLKNGVPEEAVLREDQATFTYENAIRSRAVTDTENLTVKRAVICCKSWHARRCLLYYQLLFPETEIQISGVDIDGIGRDTWQESEKGIETVLLEVERCGAQFHRIMKEGLWR